MSMQKAVFAAGCFWCAEHDFENVPGVLKVISGYTGGELKNPTYEQVSAGGTGHFETVEVYYDPGKISYEQLLNFFWHNVDPEDGTGQFCDKGDSYRSAIFYQTEAEKKMAEQSKSQWKESGRFKNIATLILPVRQFYPAEDYHQDYAKKNPVRYRFYRYSCGRDARLAMLWGS
ncbi:MAG: peptide-methionine (S)-S-oxide reductase MsrA [Gammaproteobacteria bacterium]|nr:peptide-methionine (S)-S-oxide reductase MsrA [Gammaproteobacteria bacterium]